MFLNEVCVLLFFIFLKKRSLFIEGSALGEKYKF